MVNYQNGKIYKIQDVGGNMCYIGSTTKERLCQRMVEHRQKYNQWLNKTQDRITVYEIFDKYGVENCNIVLMELCPCNSRDELTKLESQYIRSENCVNKVIPDRGMTEYQKEYYINNSVVFKKKVSDYRMLNKDKIKEYKSQLVVCICGKTHIHDSKARHLRSKAHIKYMETHPIDT